MAEAATSEIDLPDLRERDVRLWIRREDELFPGLSGNKYRKLKYNLREMQRAGHHTLLTFGGAYSNHIHAVAGAGRQFGFCAIGVIRGEELADAPLNPTLADARDAGMHLHFVSRRDYARRHTREYLRELLEHFGPAYLLPEGGTNQAAVRGCAEILNESDAGYDRVCCSVGTGGTLAGLAAAAAPGQQVRGYAALKASGLEASLREWIPGEHWTLSGEYHFGGYARIDARLVRFINDFRTKTGVPLDPVYTGKMLYGILEETRQGQFQPGTRILAIHTGGLQGIRGMNLKLRKKGLPLLQL